jgi:hypothetical protein
MIDYLSIALTHGLILLAAWRLLSREDLDRDADSQPKPKPKPWLRAPSPPADPSDG